MSISNSPVETIQSLKKKKRAAVLFSSTDSEFSLPYSRPISKKRKNEDAEQRRSKRIKNKADSVFI